MDTAGVPTDTTAQHGRFRIIALLTAVALLWLATRRYFGVVFDARFYVLEALRDLHPAAYANDLYFQFGSQGRFSVFTKLYLPLLPAFGVGTTGVILTVLGQLLWLLGLFCLARRLAGDRLMWLSMAVVIGMLPLYPGGFTYGEGYVTARLFAEAFVMMGLSQLSTRPLLAIAVLLLAAALHPLMALPGLAVAFVWLALGQPRWWLVMVGGVAAAAVLGMAGIAPFTNLLRTVDPAWLAVIKARSMQCLLSSWPRDWFEQAFAVIAWAVAALVLAGPQHRRFLVAVLMVGVGGLACTYLGGDIAHNFLLIELQPWRTLWLLQLVSRIYIPLLLMGVLARTSLDTFRWTVVITMTLVTAACVARLVRYPDAADFTVISLALAIAGLAIMAASLLAGENRRGIAVVAAVTGMALIPVALSQWDARPLWIRYVESPQPPPKELTALLPAIASVYWEGGIEMLWFRMQRSSYFSCEQGTGVVFSRDTAMTYRRRAASLWPLRTSDFYQSETCFAFDGQPQGRSRAGLAKLCAREPGLGYLVLTAPLDGLSAKAWQPPMRFVDIHMSDSRYPARATDRFYIYSCSQTR